MKKQLSLFMLFIMSGVLLAGCSTTNAIEDPCKTDPSKVKIGLVTDSGGIHDKSFNQGTYEGIQDYCKKTGTGATYKESKAEVEYEPNLQNMSDTKGIEVVIAIGNTLSNATYKVAQKNPETNYVLIDGVPTDDQGKEHKLDNVESFLFNEQDSGYLVGYIAGKLTKTNKIGFIGGLEIAPVQKFGWGFTQGIHDANPDAEVYYEYSGSFNDAAKGGQIADQMYGQKVDIIFTCAGGTNDGVISSAKNKTQSGNPVWVIGVDRDMYDSGKYGDKSVILTSAMKNVGSAAEKGVEDHFAGNFTNGTTVLGFKDGGVGIPEKNPNLEGEESTVSEAEKSLENKTVASDLEGTKEAIGTMKINGKL